MKVIGITACPTGIAHTYMAQECLEKACKKRGFENELTDEDVASADVVILAVSVMIEGEERFEGKPVIHTDVDEAISNVDALMDQAAALVKGEL